MKEDKGSGGKVALLLIAVFIAAILLFKGCTNIVKKQAEKTREAEKAARSNYAVSTTKKTNPTPRPAVKTTSTPSPTLKPTATPKPTESISFERKQAIEDAKTYIMYIGGFSKKRLIEQLEYDGFSEEDATYAAEHCGAIYSLQAYQCAQSYIDSIGGFSKARLKEQLEYEGFTSSEIEYALSEVGY